MNARSSRARSPAALRTASQPRRLQILEMIWDRELAAGEIADALPVTFAAVSQHLRRLLEGGLVSVRREGRRRFYRARKDDLGTLAVLLESMWNERLDVLAEMADAAERAQADPPPEPERGVSR